jgi:hypothetical protein
MPAAGGARQALLDAGARDSMQTVSHLTRKV